MRKFTKYPSNYVCAYTKKYDCNFIVNFNGGGTGKRYTKLNIAISDLRDMIENTIAQSGEDSVDLEDCFVAEELGNDEIGEIAYRAADDSYFMGDNRWYNRE